MKLPELRIKNSKLADEVVKILRSTDDKFEIARKMVAIADDRIRSQTTRDVIDLAIEYARTPNFTLSKGDCRRIRQLLQSAKKDLLALRVDDVHVYLLDPINYLLEYTPGKTACEQVFEKLAFGETRFPRAFSPYLLRIYLQQLVEDYGFLHSFNFSDQKCKKHLHHLSVVLSKLLEIVGAGRERRRESSDTRGFSKRNKCAAERDQRTVCTCLTNKCSAVGRRPNSSRPEK